MKLEYDPENPSKLDLMIQSVAKTNDADKPELHGLPCWASHVADSYGNVVCKECGTPQSPHFNKCIKCCNHEELEFTEEWDNGWRLDVECACCGKNFDLSNDLLIGKYKAVLK